MATGKQLRSRRAEARELARTPVADPYRGQLVDPFTDRTPPTVPAELLGTPIGARHEPTDPLGPPREAAYGPSTGYGYGYGHLPSQPAPLGYPQYPPSRTPAPRAAITAGVLGLVIGVAVGVFGVMVIALVNLVHTFDLSDRSFYAGSDAAYMLMGLLNLALSALLVTGSIALLGRRLTGRVLLTAGLWPVAGFSVFWWHDGATAGLIPFCVLVVTGVALSAAYHPTVGRWLGVRPPPQPE
jgi:hypothetical protein